VVKSYHINCSNLCLLLCCIWDNVLSSLEFRSFGWFWCGKGCGLNALCHASHVVMWIGRSCLNKMHFTSLLRWSIATPWSVIWSYIDCTWQACSACCYFVRFRVTDKNNQIWNMYYWMLLLVRLQFLHSMCFCTCINRL